MSENEIEKLLADVKEALADGKITIFEILRIVKDLIAIINKFLTGKSIS